MAAAAEEAAAQMLIRSDLFVVSCAFLMKPSRWKKKKSLFGIFIFIFTNGWAIQRCKNSILFGK
jgi:hypothetical protein